MNIYGFYGEHLDNRTEWDWLSIRSDDGLNRRWRSNTVHPFLFSSETISKGRTQIVVQLEQFITNFALPTFLYDRPRCSGQSMGNSENEMTPVSETIKIGSENETVDWTFVRILTILSQKDKSKKYLIIRGSSIIVKMFEICSWFIFLVRFLFKFADFSDSLF